MTKKPPKSKAVRTEPCPQCKEEGADKKGNNLVIYEDGKKWCFRCNDKKLLGQGFIKGEYFALNKSDGWMARNIELETCRKANYKMGKYTGKLMDPETGDWYNVKDEWVQFAEWIDEKTGQIIAQKLRDRNKGFRFLGNGKNLGFWGINDYTPSDKIPIIITGGEIDRLSISQVMNYPVVSPPTGEGSTAKAIEKDLKKLLGYKYVILALDNDEAGLKATQKCLELLEVDKVRVCIWPAKDANELLQEHREEEIKKAIWNAKDMAPDHLVTANHIRERVLNQPTFGWDYPWKAMTDITYGFQFGEIHIIVAANGIGKTEFVKDLMFHFLDRSDVGIGLFSFEQDPEDTLRRLVGARLGIKLHLPGCEWDESKINAELDKIDEKIYLCERAATIEHDELFRSIKYLAKAKNKKLFVIDNIRGLGIGHDTEVAGAFMRKLQGICRSLKVSVFLLSHVAKDKYTTQVYTSTSPKNKEAYDSQTAEDVEKAIKKPGMDWESGRIPTTVNIDGPSVFGDLANYIWALGRNKVSEDSNEARILKVKALKTRLDGQKTGLLFKLRYEDSGILRQVGYTNKTESEINDDEGEIY